MKLKDYKKQIDKYFAKLSPEEIVANLDKLGYGFEPFELVKIKPPFTLS